MIECHLKSHKSWTSSVKICQLCLGILSMKTLIEIYVSTSETDWQPWWPLKGHDWGDTEHGFGQTAACKLAQWEMESEGIRAPTSSTSLMTCHRATKEREKDGQKQWHPDRVRGRERGGERETEREKSETWHHEERLKKHTETHTPTHPRKIGNDAWMRLISEIKTEAIHLSVLNLGNLG